MVAFVQCKGGEPECQPDQDLSCMESPSCPAGYSPTYGNVGEELDCGDGCIATSDCSPN